MERTASPSEPEEGQYVLGTDPAELARLATQHGIWADALRAVVARACWPAGATVLDLGCGPGFTSVELARVLGPTGRVLAIDKSVRFVAHARSAAPHAGRAPIEARVGDAASLELAPESLDGAYARWLLCWLPAARPPLAALARALRPGGAIVLQEYLDWAALGVVPRHAAVDRAVDACMRGWVETGVTIDVGATLPDLAVELGLAVEHVAPLARLGRPGSPVWRWPTDFLAVHLPRLVERGLFGAGELDAYRAEIARRERTGEGFLATPTMLDLVLRKPDDRRGSTPR